MRFEVRALLWRDGDVWRGETLELDATSSAPTLDVAMSELVATAHRVAAKELAAGEFPGRPLQDVPDIVAKWNEVNASGAAQRPWSEIYEDASQERCKSVATRFTVQPRAEVAKQGARRGATKLEIVLIQSGDWWVAQCLQFDLGGQGRTENLAMREAVRAIASRWALDQALGRTPLEDLPEAPRKFWDLFANGEEVASFAPGEQPLEEVEPVFRVAS
jgi:hypothetical protein